MGIKATWIFVAWLLDVAQFQIAADNYSSLYNGFGAIDSIRAKKAAAPMAYRVLLPWLVGWITPPGWRLVAYELVKIGLMATALGLYANMCGTMAALVMGVLWVSTFRFDYWDVYVEVLAFVLCLTTSLPLALLGAFLGALSKETAGILPILYLTLTGDWLGAFWVALVCWGTLLLVRAYTGYRPMYCSRLMIRQNWKDLLALKDGWILSPQFVSLVWIVGGLWATFAPNVPGGWIVPVLLVAGGTMGRIVEPRIFLSTSIWIAAAIAQWL